LVRYTALAVAVAYGLSPLLPARFSRSFLPVASAALFYPVFIWLISRRQFQRAYIVTLAWAFFATLALVLLSILLPERMAPRILNGVAYRNEMFIWITTGIGPEGNPSQFIPQQLRHLVIFSALSFVSVGLLALVLGAVLLNYMNFYYAALIASARNPLPMVLLGWPVWAMLRVAGYISIGVAVSGFALSVILKEEKPDRGRLSRYLPVGGVLIISDMLLKAALAPLWRSMLARFYGFQY